jgi:hypothetical protein
MSLFQHLQRRMRDIMQCTQLKLTDVSEEHVASLLVSCLAYSSSLKMKVICSSKTLVDFQWITRRYIAENRILHSHLYGNVRC